MECTCIAKHYYKRKEKEIYILSHFVQKNIRELQIKNRIYMATIEINVSEFYGVPAFYSVMPHDIFDTLESAALKGYKTATVDKAQFDKMMLDFQKKIA
jgi:hypothetical protein